jgi:hypothetical protein
MGRHKGLVIAGAALIAEGAAVAMFGHRYLEFMERQGLMDFGKRLLVKTKVRSPAVFVAVGAAEVVWGLVLVKRAAA